MASDSRVTSSKAVWIWIN